MTLTGRDTSFTNTSEPTHGAVSTESKDKTPVSKVPLRLLSIPLEGTFSVFGCI